MLFGLVKDTVAGGQGWVVGGAKLCGSEHWEEQYCKEELDRGAILKIIVDDKAFSKVMGEGLVHFR